MKLFNSQKFDNLEDLLVEQVEDMYDAEKRLCEALPKMAEASRCKELSQAFLSHLDETKQHVARLDDVFRLLGQKPRREARDAMKGLISEGEDMINAEGDDHVRDAALIASAQRVEHYEMAAYGTARDFAKQLGRDDLASIFQTTLDEEAATDEKLTSIARGTVNPDAHKARA